MAGRGATALPLPGLSRDFDLFDMRDGFGNGIPLQPHSFDAELNCLPDRLTRSFQSPGGRDAIRKVGNVGAVASGCRFKKTV